MEKHIEEVVAAKRREMEEQFRLQEEALEMEDKMKMKEIEDEYRRQLAKNIKNTKNKKIREKNSL